RRYGRVQTAPKKININKVTPEELYRHPYFRNKKLNEVIVRYREQHGPYASPEAMKAVRILDEATLRKWEPYLSF
ncbi:ComEA family DNA-binding protein, partial [Persicitalea sp.]|uniref:ComEA family DNA-binding protein n=1 Tax=Persicitalea sp. TaxID=3100273 RepID=UPI003593E22D